ncbi:MAG: archaetidylserine decarboxylase [Pseudomonadota bacterium]
MDKIFIFIQHILPQHLLSRFTGGLASLRRPAWLKNGLIRIFIRQFKVDMSEAAQPDAASYPTFNDFFTRPLRDDARPVSSSDLVLPADGQISQLGAIEFGRIFQAKGRTYSTLELLGGDSGRAQQFKDGIFTTIYLSPKDYHRVHMPVSGRLTATSYIPGKLFSVNQTTAEHVPRLFARNERLVCYFDTAVGPMAMVLVGAMVVAGIATVWAGQVAPRTSAPAITDFSAAPAAVELEKGAEMGRFMLGSTVILLFPQSSVSLDPTLTAGSSTRLGEPLGAFQKS